MSAQNASRVLWQLVAYNMLTRQRYIIDAAWGDQLSAGNSHLERVFWLAMERPIPGAIVYCEAVKNGGDKQ